VRLPVRRFLWVLVPLLLGLIALGWWRGLVGERATRRELEGLRSRRQQLERANRTLEREVEALKDDREARVRAARKALDAAAPGEILVIVPQPTPSPSPTPTPTKGAK
jgi:cell division protein FtsB